MFRNPISIDNTRKNLLNIYSEALNAVDGLALVAKEIQNNKYPESFHVIAIGTASDSMLQGVIQTETSKPKIKSALIISKQGQVSEKIKNDLRVTCVESKCSETSFKSGKVLLNYLSQLPKNEPCLFLISGGVSTMVEVLRDKWDLEQRQELAEYLSTHSYNSNEINRILFRLSEIKGGGLWKFIGERPVYCLLISDKSGDNPIEIGSGLLFPTDENDLPILPQNILKKIPSFSKQKKSNDFVWKIIASMDDAKKAATSKAIELGYMVKNQKEVLEAEAVKVAKNCVSIMKSNPNTLMIWGGKPKVILPEHHGIGGRNQHLALAAAIELKDVSNSVLLSAGTDGIDGSSKATGAIIDNETVMRGMSNYLNAYEFLNSYNSNSFFKGTNDLIPMKMVARTKVMDMVIAYHGT